MKKFGMLLPLALLGLSAQAAPGDPVSYLKLPPGFKAEVLVDQVPNARSMVLSPAGTLYVGSRGGGQVYAIRKALSGTPQVSVLAEGLKMPNGVALRDGDLYIAEQARLLRIQDVDAISAGTVAPELVTELPFKNAAHSWKYIAFGPDGKLYVPFGAPCNVCQEEGFASIMRMNADGTGREIFARGIRNTVGFDWHPRTRELWFSDNGRDMLGDEVPPCELNRAPKAGLDFGFPYCHGGDIVDPQFGSTGQCATAEPPVQKLGPHVAPLAVRFYTGSMFPKEYRNQIFIAEHGSWNRSKEAGKTGYRVTLVRLDGAKARSYEPFAEGFLDGDTVRGRPVDLLVAPDGALLVSDDQQGAIYRISYQR